VPACDIVNRLGGFQPATELLLVASDSGDRGDRGLAGKISVAGRKTARFTANVFFPPRGNASPARGTIFGWAACWLPGATRRDIMLSDGLLLALTLGGDADRDGPYAISMSFLVSRPP
jgi:hypothetical protein